MVLFLNRQIPNDKTPNNTPKGAFVPQDQSPQQFTGLAKAADLTVSFDKTNSTNEVKVKSKNYQIAFSQNAQNPTVEKSGETRYSRLPNGIKEEIILSKAPAAPFIAKYTATLSGVKPRFFKDLWHFFDSDGKEQFFIPKPFMVDQKGQKSENIDLQISPVSATQYRITITPDHNWLISPDRTYPVTVDPTIEVPGQPIQEIIDKRNQTSKTYSLPNSRFAWEGQIGPIHYKDSPGNPQEPWKEIDTVIQPVTDPGLGYSFQNLTNSFKSFFKASSKDQDTVKYEGGGSYITFTNQDNELGALRSVEGYAENNQFVYPDAYDNIDIKYSIGTSVLLEEFVLKGPRDVSKISQRVRFSDAEYRQQQDGSINFYSTKTNELVWSFPKPKMYEVNPRPNTDGFPSRFENFGLRYEIAKDGDGYVVTKVLDQEGKDWLNSPERVYPLVIDTTLDLQVGASADDCYRRLVNSSFNLTDFNGLRAGDYADGNQDYSGGARFLNITVPQATIIDLAYVSYRAAMLFGTIPTTYIEGEAADNPSTFSTAVNYDGRTRTTTVVTWTPAAWVTDTWYNSSEIKTVIQEIVNRAGFASGNALVLFWRDAPGYGGVQSQVQARAWDYTGNVSGPKLHIEYTAAAPTPTPTPTPSTSNMRFGPGFQMKGLQIK